MNAKIKITCNHNKKSNMNSKFNIINKDTIKAKK